MEKAKHIAWIDDARTLTMLLVIIGHCTYANLMTNYGGICYFDDINPHDYSIMAKLIGILVGFIYTFHMPLFMMLSGACFGLTIGKVNGVQSLAKNKAKRLLLPFLFTTLLLTLPLKYLGGYYDDSSNVLQDMFLGQVLLLGNSHLWFIASLFWIFLFYYILYKKGFTDSKYFLISLVVPTLVGTYLVNKGFEFLGLLGAIKHLLYFAIGFKGLKQIDSKIWGGQQVFIHAVLYLFIFAFSWKYGSGESWIMKSVHYILVVVMGVYGSLIMMQASKKIGSLKVIVDNKIYKTFSRYSYDLYLFSDPFNYVLLFLIYNWLGVYVTDNTSAILAFLIRFFGTIALAFVVIFIKNFAVKTFKYIYGTISKS